MANRKPSRYDGRNSRRLVWERNGISPEDLKREKRYVSLMKEQEGQPTPVKETVEEWLARGGEIKQLDAANLDDRFPGTVPNVIPKRGR